jgi:hypothetical protein
MNYIIANGDGSIVKNNKRPWPELTIKWVENHYVQGVVNEYLENHYVI